MALFSGSHAVDHRFVQEVFIEAARRGDGGNYLIQDHRFLDSFCLDETNDQMQIPRA
jgi:hypothetical protein